MGITAREGIHILYRCQNIKNWFNVDAFSSNNTPILINMNYLIKNNEKYEILIYEPILSQINDLIIDIPENHQIQFLEYKHEKTILIAGGVNSFGIGCTVCGVMFPNILGRKLNYNIQNISFNESNYLENTFDYFKNNKHPNVDISILELNHILQDDEIFEKYIKKVIKQLKSKSKYLICWYCLPKTADNKRAKVEKIIKKYLNNKKIEILDLSFIYDEKYSEMCTYNDYFINDTGNILIYKKLRKTIENIEFHEKHRRKRIWNI